jgi:hypothetical protein
MFLQPGKVQVHGVLVRTRVARIDLAVVGLLGDVQARAQDEA